MTTDAKGRRSWVYFARLDVFELIPAYGPNKTISLIKIGTSIYPDSRISEFKSTYGFRGVPLAYIDGGRDEERAMHRRFENSRLAPVFHNVQGELFYPTRDLMAFIEELRENPDHLP